MVVERRKKKEKKTSPVDNNEVAPPRGADKGGKNGKSSRKKRTEESEVQSQDEEENNFLLTQQDQMESVAFLECSDDEASDDKENADEDNKSMYSFFSQHPLNQHSLDDSSRSELPDDENYGNNRDGAGQYTGTSNEVVNESSLGADKEEDEGMVSAAEPAKGVNKKSTSTSRMLNERNLCSNKGEGAMLQSSTSAAKSRKKNTKTEVNLNTRSISKIDPNAFLAAYSNKHEEHSAQSYESPGTQAMTSTKMSSQISLSEEKAKEEDVLDDGKANNDNAIVHSEGITKSRQKKKRGMSNPALSLAMQNVGSPSPIKKEDITAAKKLEEEVAAIKIKRQKCMEYLDATAFIVDY